MDLPFREEVDLPKGMKPRGFMRASDLDGKALPDRESLVPGLIPMKTTTLLYGDGGTGKSLLALQLACATALGRPWLGMPAREGRAIYLTAEDDLDELHRRLWAICSAEGVGLGELHRLTIRSMVGEDALLATLDPRANVLAPTKLHEEIDALMGEQCPSLVVLDTLADLFPGNENDRALARQFIGLLKGPAYNHGAAVVLLAHPSLAGLNSGTGTSGSTGWSNSVRSRLYLERVVADDYEPDPDARRLTVKKANYGRVGSEILLTWQDGVFRADGTSTASGIDRVAAAVKAERIFMRLLQKFESQGRYVSHVASPSYAPKLFAESPDCEGITKRAFTGAMNALFAARKIEVRKHGPKSRERSHIALSSGAQGGGSESEF